MPSRENIYVVQYQIARCYANKLHKAAMNYQLGDEGIPHGLLLLEQDWEQIKQWQKWAADHIFEDPDVAALCSAFSELGSILLELRQDASERLLWLEAALTAARHLNDKRAELIHLLSTGRAHQVLSAYDQAVDYAQRALGLARQTGNWVASATALYQLAMVAYRQGEYTIAQAHHNESLSVRQEIGDRRGIAENLSGMGLIAEARGKYEIAEAHYRDSLVIQREIADWRGIADSLASLGRVIVARGKYEVAEGYYQDSLGIRREIGDRAGIASSLVNLGVVANTQGEYTTARAYLENGLAISHELGNRSGVGQGVLNLGLLAWSQGDYEAAQVYIDEALAIFQAIHNKPGIGLSLLWRGKIMHAQGAYGKAQIHAEDSLLIAQDLGVQPRIAMAFDLLGLIAFDRGELDEAVARYTEAIASANEIDDHLIRYEIYCHAGFIIGADSTGDKAVGYLREALNFAYDNGTTVILLEALLGFAQVFLLEGKHERSAQLLGLITQQVATAAITGSSLSQHRLVVLHNQLSALLSANDLETKLRQGASMELDAVVSELLR
jgi:tetratricopeptide (TPR) repeat protein